MWSNKEVWENLHQRLDKVEEHVSKCAQRHEVDEVKESLKENQVCLNTLSQQTTQINTTLVESRRWMGIIASLIVVGIPILEEVKDAIFAGGNTGAQLEIFELKKSLTDLELELEKEKRLLLELQRDADNSK